MVLFEVPGGRGVCRKHLYFLNDEKTVVGLVNSGKYIKKGVEYYSNEFSPVR